MPDSSLGLPSRQSNRPRLCAGGWRRRRATLRAVAGYARERLTPFAEGHGGALIPAAAPTAADTASADGGPSPARHSAVANAIYDARQAKRLFGFIGGGTALGGMMGAYQRAA